jgi:L-fucose mutarotase/ribose pyranase (RbsD/FucU family)
MTFQGSMLICIRSFAFFEEGRQYYCTHDTGEHFYVWCPHERFGVSQIKLTDESRQYFRRAQI